MFSALKHLGVSTEGAETTANCGKSAVSVQLHICKNVTTAPFKVEQRNSNKKLTLASYLPECNLTATSFKVEWENLSFVFARM